MRHIIRKWLYSYKSSYGFNRLIGSDSFRSKKPVPVIILLLLLLTTVYGITAAGASPTQAIREYGNPKDIHIDYSLMDNWAYREIFAIGKDIDVFFVCPTIYPGDDEHFNMSINDMKTKKKFVGAINMEKGIYDGNAKFFAPYYRMAGLNVYALPENECEKYLQIAYNDVKDAFSLYLAKHNGGRPIILAGFSQGADHVMRLMKDFFRDKNIREKLIAAYVIGWMVSPEELREYPHLRFAKGERDTGVIVSFNTESEFITSSLIIPENKRTLAINPLNWRTDNKFADGKLNKGACFTDYSGNIVHEIPHLTGAYIDTQRGVLKATDVTPEEYPPMLPFLEIGIYHVYDYQFFYRNLQENVSTRIASYLSKRNECSKAA